MKFTVMGFNQQAILDINESSSHKLDVTDLLLLRWLVDFSQTEKMTKVVENNQTYYWVNYQAVLDDLPVLKIGRRMLAARLQKMVDAGILKSSLKRNGGTFTLYGFGDKYEMLISDDKHRTANHDNEFAGGDNKFTGGCKNIYNRGDNKFTEGLSINLHPKYPSTNNPSTKDTSTISDSMDVAESTSPIVISLQTNIKGKFFDITEEHVKKFKDCYQAVDIIHELKRIELWLESNPKKRKTMDGMMKFVNSWLGRAQDKPQKQYNTSSGYQQQSSISSPTGNPFADALLKAQGGETL